MHIPTQCFHCNSRPAYIDIDTHIHTLSINTGSFRMQMDSKTIKADDEDVSVATSVAEAYISALE